MGVGSTGAGSGVGDGGGGGGSVLIEGNDTTGPRPGPGVGMSPKDFSGMKEITSGVWNGTVLTGDGVTELITWLDDDIAASGVLIEEGVAELLA